MKKKNTNKKVALILGGIKGIGKAIALKLAKQGVNIAINYYDWEEFLPDLKNDFSKIDSKPLLVKTNLLKTDKIELLIQKVIDKFGKLNILINNIERGGWPIVHGSYTNNQWDLEFETTLRAKQWVFEAAIPYLKKSKDGNVINFSSIAALIGRSGPASLVFNEGYSAANRGISLLTETWARISAPNVRVNEIMLGFVETRHGPKTRGWGLLSEKQKQNITSHTLLKRIGKLDDVARAVNFILFDAPYMTGSVLRLDGGYVIGGENVEPMPKGVV